MSIDDILKQMSLDDILKQPAPQSTPSRKKNKFSNLPMDFGGFGNYRSASWLASHCVHPGSHAAEQKATTLPPSSGFAQTVSGYATKMANNPFVRETISVLDLDPLGMLDLVGRLDHPLGINSEIVGIAEQLLIGKDSDVEKAKAIYDWITGYTRCDKLETHKGYRNALQTYTDKRGVCGELSYLYIAIARLMGVPCQKVSVRVNEWGEEVNHACAAINISGATLLVDPMYRKTNEFSTSGFGIRHQEFTVVPDEKMIAEYHEWNEKKPATPNVTHARKFTGATKQRSLGNHLHDIHGTHNVGISCEEYYHQGTSCARYEQDMFRYVELPMHGYIKRDRIMATVAAVALTSFLGVAAWTGGKWFFSGEPIPMESVERKLSSSCDDTSYLRE